MSDHFVDAEYQKKHHHDPMGGTPHIEDEDDYRYKTHPGRHTLLSDKQFEQSYPTGDLDPATFSTLP